MKNEDFENAVDAGKDQPKIDPETAEMEFVRFCENNEIEHDESKMTDEEKETFGEIKKRIIKACMKGRVETDGTSMVYTISDFSPSGFKGEKITIKRPQGNAYSAMDSYRERENVGRLHGFVSAMTGKDIRFFSKIDVSDWKFFNSVAQLFLSL